MKLQRLSKPAKININVQPVALPLSCAPSGTMCQINGWGDTMSLVPGGMFAQQWAWRDTMSLVSVGMFSLRFTINSTLNTFIICVTDVIF